MNYPFSAIRQSKVSEDIVEQIKTLIREGQLKPGERLPSERQLAQILEVGRSSLREAINSLAMMGLVEVRQRKGIYVGSVSASLISDPLRQLMASDRDMFTHLYDIRIDIEVASATAAAENRSTEQLGVIASYLASMQDTGHDHSYNPVSDLQFHLAIAEATGNFLRVHIIKEIFDIARSQLHTAIETITTLQGNIDAIFRQHSDIYKAIADKDPSGAGAAMGIHLQWVKSEVNTFL
ncbi:MAG: FadR/GntR family transcriptional regulator [Desulfobacteraceae bacterium]|jgi:GntR family transcriptional regulator, transcriptional repressor for pyruvate dehydrogenase complex